MLVTSSRAWRGWRQPGDDDAANNLQARGAAMAAGDRRGSTSPGHGSRVAAAAASLAGK
jgi:hypothetical protein